MKTPIFILMAFISGGIMFLRAGEPLPLEASVAARALDPALMSLAIYDPGLGLGLDPDSFAGLPAAVAGWTGPKTRVGDFPTVDPATGLACGLYERTGPGGPEAVLAFRGSTTRAADWMTHLLQTIDDPPEMYLEAARLAATVRAGLPAQTKLIFCGHSGGGALATFSTLATGEPAVCFGALPLGFEARKYFGEAAIMTAERQIVHFYLAGDPVFAASILTGRPPGRLVDPALTPPNEPGAHFLPLMLKSAGLIFEDDDLRNAGGSTQWVIHRLESHQMATYVAALLPFVSTELNKSNVLGDWRWKDSFLFKLVNGDTKVRLTANHRFLLSSSLSLVIGGEQSQRLSDEGGWSLENGLLRVDLPATGTFVWRAEGGGAANAILWRQIRFIPPSTGNAQRPGTMAQLKSAAKSVMFSNWDGQTFVWHRPPDNP